jgi:RimJ/RimL family protein N-acetyltransferase
MIEAPQIITARLRLRAHRVEDYDAACAMWADAAVTRYIGGRASTPQQTWQRLLTYMGHWRAMGYGYWAIEETSSGDFIGEIGFADFKREIAESMRDVPEIGFALVSRAHGRGYGTEALRTVLAWGDEHLPSQRTVALVNEDNAASVHMLRKCGYSVFDRTAFNDVPVLLMERSNPSAGSG